MEPRTTSAASAAAYVEVREHTLECVASLSEEGMVILCGVYLLKQRTQEWVDGGDSNEENCH